MEALKKYSRVEFKRIRTAYKITHKEIADVIGKTPQYVCDYENGRRGSSAVEFLLSYILNNIVEEKKVEDALKEYFKKLHIALSLREDGEPNKWMAADVLNHWIGAEALDKIRDEIIDINVVRDEYSQRQNDYCDGVEFAKRYVLQIIDKYKAES